LLTTRDREREGIPVVDLFAGPGGLCEGFSSLLGDEGRQRFDVRLSIEKDSYAHQTLQLRAFFRQFSARHRPGMYYDVIRGAASPLALYRQFPQQAERAVTEAWHAALGSAPHSSVHDRIAHALGGARHWVLIGGPPCQAYSVAGRSRNKGVRGYRPDRDERQYLYTEYLQIIAEHWPSIFVMENVKGLLSAKVYGHNMLELILSDLADPARFLEHRARKRRHRYTLISLVAPDSLLEEAGSGDFVIEAERFGIPQARHRVIVLGVRDDLGVTSLRPSDQLVATQPVNAPAVLDGLPAVRSGLSVGRDSAAAWLACLRDSRERRWVRGARTAGGPDVQSLLLEVLDHLRAPDADRGGGFLAGEYNPTYRPEWFSDPRLEGVCNHVTREHMPADLHRYLYAACFSQLRGYSPKLRHFPADLLPRHQNVTLALNGHGYFADRFRVQVSSRPATTVTSHIAKDGHGFIHPDPHQCRSLTVREAARLQTFPDNYCFVGPRTAQYSQVGNAVPPLLAHAIATSVYGVLSSTGARDDGK
jgi:DNA (cytosine-5)-methyltransferase 1